MQRVMEIIDRVRTGQLGFRMDELMSGTHKFVDGAGPEGEHPFSFTITWGADDMARFLNPLGDGFMSNELEGVITVGGLTDDAPCQGTLELRYFQEGKIRYTIDFEGPDGKAYRYVGEKRDIRPWNLHRTHTTCYGTVTEVESGRVISDSVVYFDLKLLPTFAASIRLA
jgi:hypothetical protein